MLALFPLQPSLTKLESMLEAQAELVVQKQPTDVSAL